MELTEQDKAKSLIDLASKIESIIEKIKVFDIRSLDLDRFGKIINWYTVIAVGMLLAILSNFDKLLINGEIPEKFVVIICLIVIMLGLVVLTLLRIIFLFREMVIKSSLELMEKIRYKVAKGEVQESDMDKFNRAIIRFISVSNKPDKFHNLFWFGISFIILGVAIFSGYFIYFLIRYL